MPRIGGNDLTPSLVQVTGIVCEALRLVMVQRLLSSDEFKMDPLVSVYCKRLISLPLILLHLLNQRLWLDAGVLSLSSKSDNIRTKTNCRLDYAPACAVINGFFTILIELPRMTTADILQVGLITLIANAFVAFLLNVSVVLLVCIIRK